MRRSHSANSWAARRAVNLTDLIDPEILCLAWLHIEVEVGVFRGEGRS